MKKIFLAVIITFAAVTIQAQTISANYIKNFVPESKNPFTANNFAPYTVSGIVITYSQAVKKIPLTINISAARGYKKPPPPKLIKYPDPPVFFQYASAHKFEADSASLASSKSSSIDVLAGVGYILPHNEGSKFIVTLNADFGVAFNNNQSVKFYFQKKLTGTAEVKKTQFVFNPNVKATYFVTDKIGIGLQLGYNNTGGVNAGVGVTIAPKGAKITFPPNFAR